MKLFPERVSEQLERALAPAWLIAGPERLLVEETADRVRQAARAAGVAERIRLAAEGHFDWSELGQATETGSLFSARRLVEVRLPTGKPGTEGGKAIRQWLDTRGGGPDDDVLMIICDQWEPAQERSAWARAVEKVGAYVPCWKVKPARLPGWIGQRLRQRGLVADATVCGFLAERLEGNLLAAAQEADRLALLYPRGELTLDDVRRAVADNARFDGFRLVELVLGGQAGPALRCIRVLRESDSPPPAVLWALGRELEIAAEIARRSHREPVSDLFSGLRVWKARQGPIEACIRINGPARLERAVARLGRLDLLSKGQAAGDFWQEFERLCVDVAMGRVPGQEHAA